MNKKITKSKLESEIKEDLEKSDFWCKITKFFTTQKSYFIAGILTLLCLGFFVLTAYPEYIILNFRSLSIRWSALILSVVIVGFSYIAAYFSSKNLVQTLSIWLNSVLLSFFSLSYFLSIENYNFYPFIIALLCGMIFFINLDLFGLQKYPIFVLVPQILLFNLQTFSLLNFFQVDRIFVRNFSDDILAGLFSLNPIIWLGLDALACVLVTVSSFGLKNWRKITTFGLIAFVLFFQILLGLYNLNFEVLQYWQKTLIFLVVWDYLLHPLAQIAVQNIDKKYQPRLAVSTFYHSLLILVIIVYSFFIG